MMGLHTPLKKNENYRQQLFMCNAANFCMKSLSYVRLRSRAKSVKFAGVL
jgi:hypothetical protein